MRTFQEKSEGGWKISLKKERLRRGQKINRVTIFDETTKSFLCDITRPLSIERTEQIARAIAERKYFARATARRFISRNEANKMERDHLFIVTDEFDPATRWRNLINGR